MAYKPLALPIIGEMGMYNTITGSNPVLTTNGSKMRRLIIVERRDARVHTKDR